MMIPNPADERASLRSKLDSNETQLKHADEKVLSLQSRLETREQKRHRQIQAPQEQPQFGVAIHVEASQLTMAKAILSVANKNIDRLANKRKKKKGTKDEEIKTDHRMKILARVKQALEIASEQNEILLKICRAKALSRKIDDQIAGLQALLEAREQKNSQQAETLPEQGQSSVAVRLEELQLTVTKAKLEEANETMDWLRSKNMSLQRCIEQNDEELQANLRTYYKQLKQSLRIAGDADQPDIATYSSLVETQAKSLWANNQLIRSLQQDNAILQRNCNRWKQLVESMLEMSTDKGEQRPHPTSPPVMKDKATWVPAKSTQTTRSSVNLATPVGSISSQPAMSTGSMSGGIATETGLECSPLENLTQSQRGLEDTCKTEKNAVDSSQPEIGTYSTVNSKQCGAFCEQTKSGIAIRLEKVQLAVTQVKLAEANDTIDQLRAQHLQIQKVNAKLRMRHNRLQQSIRSAEHSDQPETVPSGDLEEKEKSLREADERTDERDRQIVDLKSKVNEADERIAYLMAQVNWWDNKNRIEEYWHCVPLAQEQQALGDSHEENTRFLNWRQAPNRETQKLRKSEKQRKAEKEKQLKRYWRG